VKSEKRMANGEWRMANELLELQIMHYARRGGLPVCRKGKKFETCPPLARLPLNKSI